MPVLTEIARPTGLAARQVVKVVTQTIAREYTSFVTVVTLGQDFPTSTTSTHVKTTSIAAAGASQHHPRGHNLKPNEVGAIVGCIGALILVLIIAGVYSVNMEKKPAAPQPVAYDYSYYDFSSYTTETTSTDKTGTSSSSRSKKKKKHHHGKRRSGDGSGVRRPPPAAMRQPGVAYSTYRTEPLTSARPPGGGTSSRGVK